MEMQPKLKQNIVIIAVASALLSFTVLHPSGSMFGKTYYGSRDFTCCKQGQLYIHHYYEQKICWLTTDAGYIVEPVGKPDASGCNIECAD